MKINTIQETAGTQIYFIVYDKSQVSPKDFKTHLKTMDTEEFYIEYKSRHELETEILTQYNQFVQEANLIGNVYVVLRLSDGSFLCDYENYTLPAEVTSETISNIIDRHFDLITAPL